MNGERQTVSRWQVTVSQWEGEVNCRGNSVFGASER